MNISNGLKILLKTADSRYVSGNDVGKHYYNIRTYFDIPEEIDLRTSYNEHLFFDYFEFVKEAIKEKIERTLSHHDILKTENFDELKLRMGNLC